MALPPELDHEKLAEAAMALLGLTSFTENDSVRAWKSIDWDLMDLLHQKGWISDPARKAKSVLLTAEGARVAQDMLERHFRRR